MTKPNDPDRPSRSEKVDAQFAALVSSLPDLASIDQAMPDEDLEMVEILLPHPGGTEAQMRVVLEVPSEIAPTVRAEFSPERVGAMMQAVEALVALASPPKP